MYGNLIMVLKYYVRSICNSEITRNDPFSEKEVFTFLVSWNCPSLVIIEKYNILRGLAR